MDERYRLGLLALADLDRLVALEAVCFRDPWSARSFREFLTMGEGRGTDEPVGVVGLKVSRTGAEEGSDTLVGYLLARTVGPAAEILNVAVDPRHRRRGVGDALVDAGLRHLQCCGVTEAFLEVRESNRDARVLYERHGFRVVGMRPAYYRRPTEDALVMRRELARPA